MLAVETDVLTEYDQLSGIMSHFQVLIPKSWSKEALEAGARRLGLWHNGILCFGSETELVVLMDYCLYNMLQEGLNAAARYMLRNPPLAGSDDELVLNAMANARFAMLSVSKAVPGVGIECYDLLRREDLFVANRNFSKTAQKGAVLASRLLSMPNFEMCTGAALPVFAATMYKIEETLNDLQRRLGAGYQNVDDPRIAPELSTGIIRTCLRCGAGDWIRYADSSGQVAPDTSLPFEPVEIEEGGGPTSRNRPCPCGSGLKYKRCCGQLKRW